jgi:hypothetical protein
MGVYLKFIAFFTISHTAAYIIAGVIALKISKDIYENKKRAADFLRDMANKEESSHVSKYFLPAQIVRALLMTLILLPVIDTLISFSFLQHLYFFAGLMFIFTHLAAASPFMDNIEGFVYMRKKYFIKKAFLKFQAEMILYSILFGVFMGFLMPYVS